MRKITESYGEAKEIITDISVLTGQDVEANGTDALCEDIYPGDLLQEIVVSLKNTMRKNNLKYLSAPQIGYRYRVMCIRYGENTYTTYVNPSVHRAGSFGPAIETCASLPGKKFLVPRYYVLEIEYMTPLGERKGGGIYGEAAHIFQHAMEHINGICIDSYGFEVDDAWDTFTEDQRAEITKMYFESLDAYGKELRKEIDDTPELKQIYDASNFLVSVDTGETQIEFTKETTNKDAEKPKNE